MQIYKIVLTGGPCAGKTTTLNAVSKYLKEKQIPVVTVPETATELIINGMTPNAENIYGFQNLVLKRQLAKEKDALEYVQKNFANYDKCVIIYDRGICDNAAYLNDPKDFQKLLSENGLNETWVLDDYDLVLDLLSLAVCKKEAYNLNNVARTETAEQAAIIDTKTSNAWAKHHNLKLLSSKVSLEEQIKTVIDYINNLLNENENQEKVRYLVNVSKSNLNIYQNNESIKAIEFHFGVGLPDNYHFVITKRANYYCYILEIYQEIDNKRITIIRKNIDYDKFNYMQSNYQYLKYDKSEKYFVANQTLYKLIWFEDKVFIEIQNNTASKEYILPEGIVIYHNEDIEIQNHADDIRNYVKKLILKK